MSRVYFGLTAPGQLLYHLSGRKFFVTVEESPGWTPPAYWKTVGQKRRETLLSQHDDAVGQPKKVSSFKAPISRTVSASEAAPHDEKNSQHSQSSLPKAAEGVTAAEDATAPLGAENDFILVDWYEGYDPENPLTWTRPLKTLFMGSLMLLTGTVYMGAAIISPGIPYLIEDYGISPLVGSLTIALYVFGYGLGPLIFSPMSEIPAIGRLPMYIAPLFLFFAVNFAGVFTPTFGGLLAVRFVSGFLASPALATGGASVQDIFEPTIVPLGLCLWVVAAYQGPGLGPPIVGYAVQHFGTWRWSLGIHQMLVCGCLVIVFFCFPESSGANILARRARRVRQVTGNDRYRSQSEIDQSKMTASQIVSDAIIKPFEIAIKDPSVAYIHIYTSLLYAFYYLFFASFPIIFMEEYGYGIGKSQLPYLAIAVGGTLFCAAYMTLFYIVVIPLLRSGNPVEPEEALTPAFLGSAIGVSSLFAVGWTAGRTSWVACTVFTGTFAGSNFFVIVPAFIYLASSYPAYAASIFAMNDAVRSSFAAGFLIAGSPLFENLGIGPGMSLVGGLTALCVPPLFFLYKYGKNLRARSSFAVKT